jgi:dephospho-CoA kinase
VLNIGITGGIGSGKSTVCRIFECLGLPVYYADDRARFLTNSLPAIHALISEVFGPVFTAGGTLDREKMAGLVFSDPLKLEQLNNIVHLFVKEDYIAWRSCQDAPATLSEAAIYFETGRYKDFDKMILVTAPEQLRIERVTGRSGIPAEEVLRRMANQWSDDRKIPLADFIIVNDERESLVRQVMAITEALKLAL